jgi:hypothetical protein
MGLKLVFFAGYQGMNEMKQGTVTERFLTSKGRCWTMGVLIYRLWGWGRKIGIDAMMYQSFIYIDGCGINRDCVPKTC